MQRISSWTDLVATLGRFRYGAVRDGVAPTPLKAEWLNMVQEEIANVIEGAGVELSKDKDDQLWQVLRGLFDRYLPLTGGVLTGPLVTTKGIRSAKGLPSGQDAGRVGYAFSSDGDTGLFTDGGDEIAGSDLVLMIDNIEVARFSAAQGLSLRGGLDVGGGVSFNAVSMLDVIYPVGSIYMNATNGANPALIFGVGTWEALAPGRLLLGVGSGTDIRGQVMNYAAMETGGEYSHLLTLDEMPEHNHTTPQGHASQGVISTGSYASGDDMTNSTATTTPVPLSGSAGGGQAHNNMPPYLAVHMWRRIE
ncbi:hypothetical protein [Pseudomonas sp. PNP]|uniref:phage baseplate protein n=1 Tax=Pseudomonas sp. PNP TaxID=361819 RepID=UPI001FEF1F37|nr:hypothetical protein [Pseudomonas sp. PNP]